MKIVYIGLVEFSRSALKHLINLGAEIVGVCTLVHSVVNSDHVDLTDLAEQHNIPVLSIEDINSSGSIE